MKPTLDSITASFDAQINPKLHANMALYLTLHFNRHDIDIFKHYFLTFWRQRDVLTSYGRFDVRWTFWSTWNRSSVRGERKKGITYNDIMTHGHLSDFVCYYRGLFVSSYSSSMRVRMCRVVSMSVSLYFKYPMLPYMVVHCEHITDLGYTSFRFWLSLVGLCVGVMGVCLFLGILVHCLVYFVLIALSLGIPPCLFVYCQNCWCVWIWLPPYICVSLWTCLCNKWRWCSLCVNVCVYGRVLFLSLLSLCALLYVST